MNERQRQLILERDGFQCVVCHGACPHRGHGEEPCKLPSPKLAPVVYFRVEKGYHPLGRLQAEHVYGKKREAWNETCAICPCCHRHKVQGGGPVYEAEVAYLATVGPEPDEYRMEREREASEKPIRKAKRKARAKAYRKQTRAFLNKRRGDGNKPSKRPATQKDRGRESEAKKARGIRLPSRVREQMERPNFNTFRQIT